MFCISRCFVSTGVITLHNEYGFKSKCGPIDEFIIMNNYLTQSVRIFETPVHTQVDQKCKLSGHFIALPLCVLKKCIRFSWAGHEKNLFFLIWKFFPNLLKS